MDVGEFTVVDEGCMVAWVLGFAQPLRFIKRTIKAPAAGESIPANADKHPSHDVFGHLDGKSIPLGAAWEKTSKNGGKPYFETVLDHFGPLYPEKIRFSLVPDYKDEAKGAVKWTSPYEAARYKADQQIKAATKAPALAAC